MPKSRRRRKKAAGSAASQKEQLRQVMAEQREAFIKKFGRAPTADDPIFFDPDSDTPIPYDPNKMVEEVLSAMNKADLPPEFMYAYRKTGLLGLGKDKSLWPKEHVQEWNDAIDEYHAIQRASGNKPDPSEWSTEIPELLASPFSNDDLAVVKECLAAIAAIEAKGITLGARVELAAALLAAAESHGYTAAEEMAGPGAGDDGFASAEEVVIRRARELYAQGRA